jgi:hypothetical protein
MTELGSMALMGKPGAGAQTLAAYERNWVAANPQGEDEEDDAYKQRKGAAMTAFQTEKKKNDMNQDWQEFQRNPPLNLIGQPTAVIHNEWARDRRARGLEAPADRPVYTKKEVEKDAAANGYTYEELKKIIEQKGGAVVGK